MDRITRTFTPDQLEAIGVPYECDAFEGAAEELHCQQVDARRWVSVHELVFRAPDDGKAWRVTYEQGLEGCQGPQASGLHIASCHLLTERQDGTDLWGYDREITAVLVEPVEVTVTTWLPVELEQSSS